MEDDIFIVGKVRLNPIDDKKVPCVEIVLDTKSGRMDGEIVLLKEIANEQNDYYSSKIK